MGNCWAPQSKPLQMYTQLEGESRGEKEGSAGKGTNSWEGGMAVAKVQWLV